MISLRIRAQLDGPDAAPFVVRVGRSGTAEAIPDAHRDLGHCADRVAEITGETERDVLVQTASGRMRLFNVTPDEIDGDVLLVVPERKLAHRLIRARSMHNTLLVTEQCDQLCLMCSQPPKEHHVDLFEHLKNACLLAPIGMTIGLSGGEPMLYKHAVFELVRSVQQARPDLEFHVLTNGQHFERADLEELRRPEFAKVLWGVPLYASDAALHDQIVQKPGAFDRLLDSFSMLTQAGASIEIRTVVMQPNAAALAPLAQFVGTHLRGAVVWAIMQLENIGYGRSNWAHLFYDSGQRFAPIASAIDHATARGLPVALYNFPRCTVPSTYRHLAVRSISDWKLKYLGACLECSDRSLCCGFFEWYREETGFAGIRPT